MTPSPVHATHPALVARLKRAEGHQRAVIGMTGAGKPRLEVARQSQAVDGGFADARRPRRQDRLDRRPDAGPEKCDRCEPTILSRTP